MACYHLARHYEQIGNIRESIVYYGKSQRIHHAIRLAKENGFDVEVYQMAMASTSNQIMLQSARYFEAKGKKDKAVDLYDKGGNLNKAMSLAKAIGYTKTFTIDSSNTADMGDRVPALIQH